MKVDDEELFARAMETLGVKGQPARDGVAAKKRSKHDAPPAARLLPDDDLDFDAIMREGRGPAKLEPDRRSGGAGGAGGGRAARTSGGGPGADGSGERPAGTGSAAGRVIRPEDYAASVEERALFEAAMREGSTVPSPEIKGESAKGAGRPRPKPARVEALAARLKRRAIELEAQLDLHGSDRKDGERRLRAFVEECVRERWTVVAIICGRGVHSDGGRAVLKPMAERLLREELRGQVREVVEAPSWLGGSGTLIVEIRLDPST